jgi:hypothetical protein
MHDTTGELKGLRTYVPMGRQLRVEHTLGVPY